MIAEQKYFVKHTILCSFNDIYLSLILFYICKKNLECVELMELFVILDKGSIF